MGLERLEPRHLLAHVVIAEADDPVTPQASPGDANGDGQFSQEDLDQAQAAGKFNTGELATFAQGDWNGDGRFDSADIIHALSAGEFERAVGSAPRGAADAYGVAEGGQLVVDAAGGVLANDLDENGDFLTARLLLAPAWGKIELRPDGSFRYTPNHDFSGSDTLVYVPNDGDQDGAPTTVELNVTPINDAPLGRDDFRFTRPDTPLVVSAREGLLSNDIDVDSVELSAMVSSGPEHGTVQLARDGSFTYMPDPGFRGMDRFSYLVSDGSLESNVTSVSISVNQLNVVVSEFAASVQDSYRDFDNQSSDWIEVTNLDSVPVDLRGWYLTDDGNNLTRWKIPIETVVDPGQSLIVIASGKNFVAPTGELHTDFRLARAGEYLALVDPDGSSIVWDVFPRFPRQARDISFGVAETTTTRQLVAAGTPARVLLPDDDRLGRQWTAIDFDDADWSTRPAAIGYAAQLPGTVEPGFSARMLKVGGGLVGLLETARAAESLFDGTADRADYFISRDVRTVVPVVNFGGIQSVTPAGDFPEAIPYPDGTTFNTLDDFAIRVSATVTIPEGQWTIGFGSSDGGLLRLGGTAFLETFGESGESEIIDGDGEIIFNETRRKGWTTGTFNATTGGVETTLEAIFFERRAADFFEIAIASGHTGSGPDPDDGWMLLSDGALGWQVETIKVPAQPNFDLTFRSDLQTEMFDHRTSAYSRIPFEIVDVADLDRLELRMRYDDAFVAYLNGSEVARDNITGNAAGNSEADRDRRDADAGVQTIFDITEYLSLLRDGTNVLAIHGLSYDSNASGFLMDPELIAVNIHPASPGFMPPTPGERNAVGGIGVLDPPTFSVEGGTFREPFVLQLMSSDPRGTIRYTMDGSVPGEDSPVFIEPIEILVTSQVRARTFLNDYLPSQTGTQLFLRLGEDVHGFDSNLPLMVFDTLGQKIPETNATIFANSIGALFDIQETGRSNFDGQPDLISRAGFKLRGSSSSGYPKKPYRMEFRQDQNDEDRDVDILGLPAESDFILVPGYQFNRSLNRNTIIYDLSNQAGAYAARTRYVEVFVNTGRGELTQEAYVGVYALIETIKVGDDRLDIGKLSPQYATEPLVTGGYILKFDRAGPGDTGIVVGPEGNRLTYQVVEPAEENLKQNAAQLEYITGYLTDFITALVAPNFTHPELGLRYTEWVDVDSLIDHYILYELWQATDALFFSGHWFKPRDGKLRAGPIWDFDRSAGSTDPRNNDPRRWNAIDSAPMPWHRFFADLEFRQAFIDRWAVLQLDVLSFENISDTFDRLTGQIAEAQVRNFERWTGAPPRSNGGMFGELDGTWEGEVRHMKLWLEARQHWMNSLFLQSPQFATSSRTAADGTTTTVTLRGDLNRDNRIDATDMVLLSRDVIDGTSRDDFDLTGDAIVDQADILQMAKLLDTLAGDADLDGDVDVDDEGIFLENLQRAPNGVPPTWLEADFDADGDVDQDDGVFITENFGFDRNEVFPVGKKIYYTTDGSDPRLPGGRVSPSAIEFDGSFDVTGSLTIMARAYDPEFNIPVRGFQQEVDDPEAWSGLTTFSLFL